MTTTTKNGEPTKKATPAEGWQVVLAFGWMILTPGAIIALGWGFGLMASGGYLLAAGWIGRRDQVLKMG